MKWHTVTLLLTVLLAVGCVRNSDEQEQPSERLACLDLPANEQAGPAHVTVYFGCSKSVLPSEPLPVQRYVGEGQVGLTAAITEMLKGPSEEERALGFGSGFSNETAGMLHSVRVSDSGRAVVDFKDLRPKMNNASASAAAGQLMRELTMTVFQFPEIHEVEFQLDGSCDLFGDWLQQGCGTYTRDGFVARKPPGDSLVVAYGNPWRSLPDQGVSITPVEPDDLPAEVRSWAHGLTSRTIGGGKRFGEDTYLVVSATNICPNGVSVSFQAEPALVLEREVVVSAYFNCVASRDFYTPWAVARMPNVDKPIRLELLYGWLPTLLNRHDLPDVPLPADTRGVLVTPADGDILEREMLVTGYAGGLFEGSVVVRILNMQEELIEQKPTTAAGGMGPNWGSFDVVLSTEHLAPGAYWVELGDYSMSTGEWQLMHRVKVEKR